MTGSIPSELGQLTQLYIVYLQDNSLEGIYALELINLNANRIMNLML